jgi:hypothetical protein
MSAPDYPLETEAQQILAGQARLETQFTQVIDALNGLGANVQWIIDNVSGIFQMFSSPAMMAQMQAMMGGGQSGGQNGPADGPADGPGTAGA